MNKLAVLAFTLLIFFSTMLWYLASGSLNDYLKSQVRLQGQYYSQQKTTLALVDFSTNSGLGKFEQITLANPTGYQSKYALTIDNATIAMAANKQSFDKKTSAFKENAVAATTIKRLNIDKLVLNQEISSDSQSNIFSLIALIEAQLANDYPEQYPQISAKLYAQKNPELNAQAYADSHPDAGPIVEHTKKKKTRGKPQAKLSIQAVTVKTLIINLTVQGEKTSSQFNDLSLGGIATEQGIVANQMGGELLLMLLKLTEKNRVSQ